LGKGSHRIFPRYMHHPRPSVMNKFDICLVVDCDVICNMVDWRNLMTSYGILFAEYK
jgi:hypothetical protein